MWERLQFISDIRPFVRLKGPQLDLASKLMDFYSPRKKMSPEALEARRHLGLAIKAMNAKGKPETIDSIAQRYQE